MLVLCRGVPKKRLRAAAAAAARANTETSIVVATPSVMQFPINEAVQRAATKKRERQASSSSGAKKTKGSRSTSSSTRESGSGSNEPVPLQSVILGPVIEDAFATVQLEAQETTPKRRNAIMKKLTPKRLPLASGSPSSPASNTRSKKKLELQ